MDNNCAEVEQSKHLSADAIARGRTELGRQALTELARFRPFQIAEQAATAEVDSLQKRRDALTPQQWQMLQKLTKALRELREGRAATERLLLERCKLREGAQSRTF